MPNLLPGGISMVGQSLFRSILLGLIALSVTACAALIAPYSLEAYKNATSLKAETLAMIDLSSEPYSEHVDEARALKTKLEAAQEFAAGMPKNRLSTMQWALMTDPETGVVGRFFTSWAKQGTLGDSYRENKREQVRRAFDDIICLEANKEKDTDCVDDDGSTPEEASGGDGG